MFQIDPESNGRGSIRDTDCQSGNTTIALPTVIVLKVTMIGVFWYAYVASEQNKNPAESVR